MKSSVESEIVTIARTAQRAGLRKSLFVLVILIWWGSRRFCALWEAQRTIGSVFNWMA